MLAKVSISVHASLQTQKIHNKPSQSHIGPGPQQPNSTNLQRGVHYHLHPLLQTLRRRNRSVDRNQTETTSQQHLTGTSHNNTRHTFPGAPRHSPHHLWCGVGVRVVQWTAEARGKTLDHTAKHHCTPGLE